MNTSFIAIKNLKKNFSFFFLYFVSIAFVITLFFAFTSFSMNEVMLEKISVDGRVETMCNTISIFLMVFVIFYMTCSNRFFLRRRTKELGIYALIGCRKSLILRILTAENLLILGGAFILGLLFGAILHKGIVLGISRLLQLAIEGARIPFFEKNAILKTVCFIFFVILVLAVTNGVFLYKTSLMNLIRYEKSAEKKLKFRKIPALSGLIMTLLGYCLALDILRGKNSLWITVGFSPVGLLTMMLVVFGTVLFIASFLPYMMQRSKNNKSSFYTETRIITTPNFIYRIRTNSKTFIMLSLLSAATLTISSVMALTLYYPIAAVDRIAPSEIEFRIDNEEQPDNVKQLIRKHISDYEHVLFTRTDIYRVPSAAENLPAEYHLGTAKGDSDNEQILREPGFECISLSSYKSLLNAQGRTGLAETIPNLSSHECILVKYQPEKNSGEKASFPLLIDGKETEISIRETTLNNPISFANSIGTLIVSDQLYGQICRTQPLAASIMSINGKAAVDNEQLYQDIEALLGNSPYLQGHSHRIQNLVSLNSSTFLLIGFLVVLFFIAAGSILYFNNISAISDSRADYEILRKIGFSDRKIKTIIQKQVLAFFSIPFLFGLLDSLFAAMVYKAGLMQNLLGNTFTQYIPIFAAILVTAAIYLLYYLLTVKACCKTVQV